MHVPPTCDVCSRYDDGGKVVPAVAKAIHVVINKTTGKILYVCADHVGDVVSPDCTYSIFPAKDYSQPSKPAICPGCPYTPVHQHEDKWWFWDETWGNRYGPFDTEGEAMRRCKEYADQLIYKKREKEV